MRIEERMEANAIIERIVDPKTDTFERQDAIRLIDLIPCQTKSKWPFLLSTSGERSSGTTQGHAAGHGTVSMDEETEKFGYSIGQRTLWRVGGYKVTHVKNELTITTMMDVDPDSDNECYLRYRKPGHPTMLQVMAMREVTFGLFSFSFGRRATWKTPSLAQGERSSEA